MDISELFGSVFLRSGHRSISFFSKNRDQGEDKCHKNRFLAGQVYTWTSLLEPFFAFFIGYVINVILCTKELCRDKWTGQPRFSYIIYTNIKCFFSLSFFLYYIDSCPNCPDIYFLLI